MKESFDLARFSLKDMAVCMRALRSVGKELSSMESVGQKLVELFYESFENAEMHGKDLVLVRLFKTHDFGSLPDYLRQIVDRKFPRCEMLPQTKCLVLLGTAGAEEAWRCRRRSENHQVLPLPGPEVVKTMPMVSEVINALGFDLADVLRLDSAHFVSQEAKSYNVFYVPEALGCPYIPDQEKFVIPYGIKSVLAFGGMLPSGNLFMMILFARTQVPEQTAEIFKSLAVSVKVSLVMFDEVSVFQEEACEPWNP